MPTEAEVQLHVPSGIRKEFTDRFENVRNALYRGTRRLNYQEGQRQRNSDVRRAIFSHVRQNN